MRSEKPRRVTDENADDFSSSEAAAVEAGGAGPHDPGMDDTWRAAVDSRLAKLDGAIEGLRSSIDGLRWVVGIFVVAMIAGFAFFGVQLSRLDGRIDRLDGKIDAVASKVEGIPSRLSEEFRAMRAEMSAQTSAIANSITATRQTQPPALPQIIVIPDHSPGTAPQPPKP